MSALLGVRQVVVAGTALAGLALTLACDRGKSDAGSTATSLIPSAPKPAGPVASGLPGDPARIGRVVNPEGAPAYSGPTGTVRGIVTASGDPAPVATAHLEKIKGACPDGREAYGHLFREGLMRSLADVLVAVTGYSGYVPAKQPKELVEARGCAFNTRTIALTYGQAIEVVSRDRDAYVPNLLGSRMTAQMFALPRGAGSVLYPPEVGHYVLTDDIKVFMMADVFVLKYATHDVTGLDGRFEITGIPVGKVRVSAMLPGTEAVLEREIEVLQDKPSELSFELPFNAQAFEAKRLAAVASASASASASAAPAPAASAGTAPR